MNDKDTIARLREELAECHEVIRSVVDTVNNIPYYERGPDLIDDYTLETDVNESFQWFTKWVKREGLDQPDGRVIDPQQARMQLDCPVTFTDRGPTVSYGSTIMVCDNLPDDKPRLDGHHDGEGYDPREDR